MTSPSEITDPKKIIQWGPYTNYVDRRGGRGIRQMSTWGMGSHGLDYIDKFGIHRLHIFGLFDFFLNFILTPIKLFPSLLQGGSHWSFKNLIKPFFRLIRSQKIDSKIF